MALSKEEKLALIQENLAEVLKPEIIESVLDQGRNVKIYWGTAPTGKPHLGYLVPSLKIAQFLAAECEVTVLVADIHAMLDNLKTPAELTQHRTEYYKFLITSTLKACGVDTGKLRFVQGSSFQQNPSYIMDFYRLSTVVSEKAAMKAGSEVVKQTSNIPFSAVAYPLLQVLDEHHLGVDAQFGGIDQRKLFTAATEWLPKLGYNKRAHLMNPMIPGLNGNKMSSSDENSKIDLLDSPEAVAKKIRKAECVPKEVEGNGVLALVEFVLLPASGLRTDTREFKVERRDAEPLVYSDIKQIHEDYRSDVLTPQALKAAVTEGILALLAPIHAEYQASKEWQDITTKAYPPPVKKGKKVAETVGV
ncbi:tyrosyl-trna synthetase [Fusarium langsethiae]|uniref:Tyrosine--tRNA ligase n=1 Tax=Fusarium langsethiae TaxID=179993 RepID=A0A0M9ETH6_FUSLA|nr:tyrosyl-trna synthetase [Fusarium langsethiae]GKU04872.1 unnamed protein product [Fusarium langsethiae]GKU13952.1 unnamed protein product [Fusarium langsethiae]